MRYIQKNVGDRSRFLAISCRPFGFIASKTLNYLSFKSFNLSIPGEGSSRNAVRPKFDIYVFIT